MRSTSRVSSGRASSGTTAVQDTGSSSAGAPGSGVKVLAEELLELNALSPQELQTLMSQWVSWYEGLQRQGRIGVYGEDYTEGDQVATRWTVYGTHLGQLGPFAPTGKPWSGSCASTAAR